MEESEIRKMAKIKAKKIRDMVNKEVCERCTKYEECPIDYVCDYLKVARRITTKTLEIVLRDEIEYIHDNESCEEDEYQDD